MASSSRAVLRRLASKDVISGRIMRPLGAGIGGSGRTFNTNAEMARIDDHDEREHRAPVSRRRDFPAGIFSDVMDPFSPTRSVRQLMNLMDEFLDNSAASQMGMGTGTRRGWDVREDKDALRMKVDMPGLGKDDVKVSVEENTLIIKGEAAAEAEAETEGRRKYSTRIELTPNVYKVDGIKAEMKNGVLKLTLPKLKPEERRDVFQVEVA